MILVMTCYDHIHGMIMDDYAIYIYITVYLLNKDTAIVHVQLVIRDDRVHVFEHCCLVIFTTLSLQM